MWHHSVSWALRHGSFCCQIPSRCAKCVQTGMTVWRQFSAICQILAAPNPQPGAPWLPERQIQTFKHGHLFRRERLHWTSGAGILTRQDMTCSTDKQPQTSHAAELFRKPSQVSCYFFPLRLAESNTSDKFHTPKVYYEEVTHQDNVGKTEERDPFHKTRMNSQHYATDQLFSHLIRLLSNLHTL